VGSVAAVALLAAASDSRPSWPSYLAFALLVVGLLAVVWHNQRARRRARDRTVGGRSGSESEPTE
jgi:hypothetical protein